MPRSALIVIAAALITGSLLWAFAGPGGSPAVCAPDGCDCEPIGEPPVRQPANAWSALSVAAVGVGALVVPRNGQHGVVGVAVVATGAAAFGAHALVTDQARALDGAAIVLLLSAVIAAEARPPAPVLGALAAAPAAATLLSATTRPLTVLLGGIAVAVLIRNHRGRNRHWVAVALALLGIGAVAWWLGDGPRCSPDAGVRWHAVWHVTAAVGLGAGLRYLARRTHQSGGTSTLNPYDLGPKADRPRGNT